MREVAAPKRIAEVLSTYFTQHLVTHELIFLLGGVGAGKKEIFKVKDRVSNSNTCLRILKSP